MSTSPDHDQPRVMASHRPKGHKASEKRHGNGQGVGGHHVDLWALSPRTRYVLGVLCSVLSKQAGLAQAQPWVCSDPCRRQIMCNSHSCSYMASVDSPRSTPAPSSQLHRQPNCTAVDARPLHTSPSRSSGIHCIHGIPAPSVSGWSIVARWSSLGSAMLLQRDPIDSRPPPSAQRPPRLPVLFLTTPKRFKHLQATGMALLENGQLKQTR
jgi:hypothetical protein